MLKQKEGFWPVFQSRLRLLATKIPSWNSQQIFESKQIFMKVLRVEKVALKENKLMFKNSLCSIFYLTSIKLLPRVGWKENIFFLLTVTIPANFFRRTVTSALDVIIPAAAVFLAHVTFTGKVPSKTCSWISGADRGEGIAPQHVAFGSGDCRKCGKHWNYTKSLIILLPVPRLYTHAKQRWKISFFSKVFLKQLELNWWMVVDSFIFL